MAQAAIRLAQSPPYLARRKRAKAGSHEKAVLTRREIEMTQKSPAKQGFP
ncbi:hypothetical protein [Afipia carboxidovorans]